MALGWWSIRPLVIAGGRTGQPRCRCACHLGRPSVACSKGCNQNDPDCLLDRNRSSRDRPRPKFSRPSGNLTGVYNGIANMGPKHLELLHELLPTASTIVSLLNPDNPNARAYALRTQAAADALGIRLQVLTAHTEADLEAAFAIMIQQRADALLVIADPFFIARRKQFVALAAGHAMPAIYPIAYFAECGGLMSYGSALGSLYQQVGT